MEGYATLQNSTNRMRSDSSEIAYRKIFIGGLSYTTDEEKLKKYFKTYGAVQDAVVMKDPVTKRSRGFGFITFCDVNSVDNALAHEPHTIDARKVEAKRAVPRSEMPRETLQYQSNSNSGSSSTLNSSTGMQSGQNQKGTPSNQSSVTSSPQTASLKSSSVPSTPTNSYTTSGSIAAMNQLQYDSTYARDPKINMDEYAYNKIFVGGLHYDTRDAEFRTYFEKYGKVLSAEVMFNRETHKSRGFGFIVFELEESAIKVCENKDHSIDAKAVEVKRAIPRSKLAPGTITSNITANAVNNLKYSVATPNAPSNTNLLAYNIRADVRRTFSTGSAQALGMSSNSILTGYTSSLGALTSPPVNANNLKLNVPSIKEQLEPMSPMVGNGNGTAPGQTPKPPIRKSTNNPTPTSAAPGNNRTVTSYAAALKSGNGSGSGDDRIAEDNNNSNIYSAVASPFGAIGGRVSRTPSFASTNGKIPSNDSLHLTPNNNVNKDLQSVFGLLPGLDPNVRPYRSYSEPIVQFDGLSSLLPNLDAMNSNLLNSGFHSSQSHSHLGNMSSHSSKSGLTTPYSPEDSRNSYSHSNNNNNNNENTLSASNAFANISWLSSPPSSVGLSLDNSGSTNNEMMSLHSIQLPPPSSLGSTLDNMNLFSTSNTPSTANNNQYSLNNNSQPDGQINEASHTNALQAMMHMQHQHQQDYMPYQTPQQNNLYDPNSQRMPSPDAWALMIERQEQHQQQLKLQQMHTQQTRTILGTAQGNPVAGHEYGYYENTMFANNPSQYNMQNIPPQINHPNTLGLGLVDPNSILNNTPLFNSPSFQQQQQQQQMLLHRNTFDFNQNHNINGDYGVGNNNTTAMGIMREPDGFFNQFMKGNDVNDGTPGSLNISYLGMNNNNNNNNVQLQNHQTPQVKQPLEQTERDEIFQFQELRLDSPEFNPSWLQQTQNNGTSNNNG
eukprot:gene13888-18625_t